VREVVRWPTSPESVVSSDSSSVVSVVVPDSVDSDVSLPVPAWSVPSWLVTAGSVVVVSASGADCSALSEVFASSSVSHSGRVGCAVGMYSPRLPRCRGGVVCPHIGQCAGSRQLECRVGAGIIHCGLGVDQFVHSDGAVFTTGEELFQEWLLARQHVVRRPESDQLGTEEHANVIGGAPHRLHVVCADEEGAAGFVLAPSVHAVSK